MDGCQPTYTPYSRCTTVVVVVYFVSKFSFIMCTPAVVHVPVCMCICAECLASCTTINIPSTAVVVVLCSSFWDPCFAKPWGQFAPFPNENIQKSPLFSYYCRAYDFSTRGRCLHNFYTYHLLPCGRQTLPRSPPPLSSQVVTLCVRRLFVGKLKKNNSAVNDSADTAHSHGHYNRSFPLTLY